MKSITCIVLIVSILTGCDMSQEAILSRQVEKGDTKALVALAVIKERTNATEALPLYVRAAEAGEPSAQRVLIHWYSTGKNVEKNDQEVFKWELKLAEGGSQPSQIQVASMYRKGKGVDQSVSKAIHWYTVAANQGHKIAPFVLGSIYRRGDGVEKSDDLSVYWYARSAANGYVNALYALGKNYEDKQSYVSAAKWYYVAAQKGDKYSSKALESMKAKLTSEQIVDVEVSADSYVVDFLSRAEESARALRH